MIAAPRFILTLMVLLAPLAAPASVHAQTLAAYPSGDFAARIVVVDLVAAPPQSEIPAPIPEGEEKPSRVKRLQGMEVVKMGNVFAARMGWSEGPATDVFRDVRTGFWIEKHYNGSVYVNRDKSMLISPLADFSPGSLSWIREQDSKGEVVVRGKKARYYHRMMQFPNNLSMPYQAWIDTETNLPLAMDDSVSRYEFEFGLALPAEPPTMPTELKAELDRYQRALRRPPRL